MCLIDDSSSGSYAGRIVPPGIPNMTSVPACSRDRINDCAPVKLTVEAAACSCGSGSVASALALWMSAGSHTVALPHPVGIRAELPGRSIEGGFGLIATLVGHALWLTGPAHDGIFGLEIASKPILLGTIGHLQRNLAWALPLHGPDVVAVLDLVAHNTLLVVELVAGGGSCLHDSSFSIADDFRKRTKKKPPGDRRVERTPSWPRQGRRALR